LLFGREFVEVVLPLAPLDLGAGRRFFLRAPFTLNATVLGPGACQFRLSLGRLVFQLDAAHSSHRCAAGQPIAGTNAQLNERGAFRRADDRLLAAVTERQVTVLPQIATSTPVKLTVALLCPPLPDSSEQS
jgi:hypothetical protein